MQYAFSVVLHYFNFDQLKRKNYSIMESATEFSFQQQFCEMNSTKRIILFTLSRYVNISTKTTTALIVAYPLPVKRTMCETRINIEMFLVSINSKLLVSVGISP